MEAGLQLWKLRAGAEKAEGWSCSCGSFELLLCTLRAAAVEAVDCSCSRQGLQLLRLLWLLWLLRLWKLWAAAMEAAGSCCGSCRLLLCTLKVAAVYGKG